MNDEKKVFWVASYPKSGNTLFRAILSSLFFTNDGIFSFKLFDTIKTFEKATRLLFLKEKNPEDFKKLDNLEIISKYWLEMQTNKRLQIKESFTFLKTHSALLNLHGNNFTNSSFSRGLIYLIRDPRDIVLSWSKHANINIDDAIKFLINKDSYIYYNDAEKLGIENLIPRALIASWNIHVKSWDFLKVPKMMIRYEDMIENKTNVILNVINFFEKNYGFAFNNIEEKIDNIILSTNFDKMRDFEEKEGFVEAPKHSKFFRVGKKNQWKEKLSLDQIKLIEENFKDEMAKFNYL